MEKPLVTVLIATYNYEKYIGNAINSIIKQDYPLEKIEIIIIDDGSADNTKKVVEDFKNKINVTYVYQNNSGKASATTKGVQLASGKYLFVLDADDYYMPDCISTVVPYFELNASVSQVSHLAYRLDEATGVSTPQQLTHNEINEPKNGIYLLKKNIFKGFNVGLGSTFAARTELLKKLAIPDDVDMYIDYYLFLMMAAAGDIVQLDKLLSVFRRHSSSYSEGAVKLENNKNRSLRYLKSAKATSQACNEGNYDNIIKKYFKLFYYQHRVPALKYTNESRLKVDTTFLFLIFNLVWFYKNKARFLINNLKQLK
jgi:glycosyltransferase involved in cell wall biosynthesis